MIKYPKVGMKVVCNGFKGIISKIHTDKLQGMADVRMIDANGTVCISIKELVDVNAPIKLSEAQEAILNDIFRCSHITKGLYRGKLKSVFDFDKLECVDRRSFNALYRKGLIRYTIGFYGEGYCLTFLGLEYLS